MTVECSTLSAPKQKAPDTTSGEAAITEPTSASSGSFAARWTITPGASARKLSLPPSPTPSKALFRRESCRLRGLARSGDHTSDDRVRSSESGVFSDS